jgi:hypothetical protein
MRKGCVGGGFGVAAQASVRWRGENRAAALRRARGAGLEPVTFERLPGIRRASGPLGGDPLGAGLVQ